MDNTTLIRQIQLEKAIGELNALKASYYDPMNSGSVIYKEVNALIKGIIQELKNELG